MSNESQNENLTKLPFMDNNLELELRVNDLLGRLTLKEKCSLCTGRHHWYTKPIKRLGVKPFAMFDGPHGVRPGSNVENKVTYFPSSICRAATWNPELSYKYGIAIAQEVRELGGNMLLAPGVNIQRTPMCGRNFEYQTEDPFLNSKLAVSVVKGIQSQKIVACIKHFICNNQETNRKHVSAEVSERALQEIYFPVFKAAVKEADVWSVMASYNKINGIYGCANKELIYRTLMNDWGFRGFLVSDWGATDFIKSTEECLNAGLSLEMPRAFLYKRKKMIDALNQGKFTEETLDEAVRRLLRVMFLTGLFDPQETLPLGTRNTPEHQSIAKRIVEEGIVLLKNENNLLPLNFKELKSIAVLGPNTNIKPSSDPDRTGSSSVYPLYEITPLQGIFNKCGRKIEILDSPAKSDVAIIFAGLEHRLGMDAEDRDREFFDLPQEQVKLIAQTVRMNENTIVVLINGSPVGMNEWLDSVPALIEAWYGGMESGNAIAEVLFGDINPSGKLPLTFPQSLSDSPAHQYYRTFPGNDKVYYDEGIFVGYRYFDKNNLLPLFPFGFGLSYTNFEYKNLIIDKKMLSGNDTISIKFDLVNTGDYTGAEVAQLYVQNVNPFVERPLKELKGFRKVFLKPKEVSNVKIELKLADLAYFDSKNHIWKVEKGLYNILIGSSSRDIRLQGKIEYIGPRELNS